jgi:hypothetical protein
MLSRNKRLDKLTSEARRGMYLFMETNF